MNAEELAVKLGGIRSGIVHTFVTDVAKTERDLSLSGYPKYWRAEAKPFFGYDQWVGWMAIPEIMWMLFQEEIGFAQGVYSVCNSDWVKDTLMSMRTREMDSLERKPEFGHDVNAMLYMLRRCLPEAQHRYPHFGWTSYDDIETARALMFKEAHYSLIRPTAVRVEQLMRERIKEFANKIQMHRTHLQYALPGTVGFWLSVIHNHFVRWVRQADNFAAQLTGKVAGATGVGSALVVFEVPQRFRNFYPDAGESMEAFFLTKVMGLGKPGLSTQIPDARQWAAYLSMSYCISTVLGQLGEDMRILQASGIGEVMSISSTSSTMAHKDGNPVGAEGMVGMYRMNIGEVMKPLVNLISDLGRDLCNSRPARDYQTLIIYLYEQLSSAERVISQMKCNDEHLMMNFSESKYLVMAELLFLSLSMAGLPEAHRFVNTQVVPLAKIKGWSLVQAMDELVEGSIHPPLVEAWESVPAMNKNLMVHPEQYLGEAVEICMAEAENIL